MQPPPRVVEFNVAWHACVGHLSSRGPIKVGPALLPQIALGRIHARLHIDLIARSSAAMGPKRQGGKKPAGRKGQLPGSSSSDSEATEEQQRAPRAEKQARPTGEAQLRRGRSGVSFEMAM